MFAKLRVCEIKHDKCLRNHAGTSVCEMKPAVRVCVVGGVRLLVSARVCFELSQEAFG